MPIPERRSIRFPRLFQHEMKDLFHTLRLSADKVIGAAVLGQRGGSLGVGAKRETRRSHHAAFLLDSATVGQDHPRDSCERQQIEITQRMDHDNAKAGSQLLPQPEFFEPTFGARMHGKYDGEFFGQFQNKLESLR